MSLFKENVELKNFFEGLKEREELEISLRVLFAVIDSIKAIFFGREVMSFVLIIVST